MDAMQGRGSTGFGSGRAGRWAAAPLLALVLAALALSACDQVESWLEQAAGEPARSDPTGQVSQPPAAVPSGPQLYCIANIGRTIVVYSLAERRVLGDTRRVLHSDPVGPWFAGGQGYYLSRVAGDGSGQNALLRFDPVTLAQTGRLSFAPNSNPVTLLVHPQGGLAYVALAGSSFDNFATNGLAVVSLPGLSLLSFLDLNAATVYPPGHTGARWTSLDGLAWDDACALGPCLYAVANNWNGVLRAGRLLVLALDGVGLPSIADAIALGMSPQGAPLLDDPDDGSRPRSLWVVNNGGYLDFGGEPGTLQRLDPALFADDTPDNETLALLTSANTSQLPADPTGIFRFNGERAWITSYPDDVVATLELDTATLAPLDATLPRITGPLFSTTDPAPALFAGMGGYGPAALGELDTAGGALLATHNLGAGNGGLTCAEYVVP
ncbi:MAG: hypothetical protein HY342_04435 [Candidatus Lambdaproteobacteria bacterium]|nr:hypothetical protein [Candidatus Lambdaproteobacteria bacterium]